MKEKIEEKIWKIVDELCKLFWDLYFEETKIEEWEWRRILKECDFDWLEEEIEDRDEITAIGTMISEEKALIIDKMGWTIIIVKDTWESIFTGWANREELTEEETVTALKKMSDLITFSLSYILSEKMEVEKDGV